MITVIVALLLLNLCNEVLFQTLYPSQHGHCTRRRGMPTPTQGPSSPASLYLDLSWISRADMWLTVGLRLLFILAVFVYVSLIEL